MAEGVTRLAGPDMGVLVITHYPRILEYLHPDVVHVLHDGRVVTSGGAELAQRIERDGYGHYSAQPQLRPRLREERRWRFRLVS